MRRLDPGGARIKRSVCRPAVRLTLLLLVASFQALALAGQESPPPTGPPSVASAPPPGATAPDVRIGLTTDPLKARVSAAGGLLILHAKSLTPVWKPRFEEPVMVVLDLPRGVVPRSVYRVQVGSFASEAEAEALKARVERLVPDPVIISFNPTRTR